MKVFDAAVTVRVEALPIVNVGTESVEALGMVVNVQEVLEQDKAPGAGSPAISSDAEHVIVFVPSVLCVTVVVPDAMLHDEFLEMEYLSDVFLS